MFNKKINLCLLFGGRSAEHEVSLRSAKSIYQALDKNKYNVLLVGLDNKGRWLFQSQAERMLLSSTVSDMKGIEVAPIAREQTSLIKINSGEIVANIDVAFSVIHGTYGEDGSLQGLLELLDVPYVGAGVLGSAVGMDKDVMKRLLQNAGISIAKYETIKIHEPWIEKLDDLIKKLSFPLFIKPANLGSSVGVSKVKNKTELKRAIKEAFNFDTKVIIEEFILGREIECAVLGNENPQASICGEVLPQLDFYSYEAKYLNDRGAILQIPAKLAPEQTKTAQELAIKTFLALECAGLARVDFFLTPGNKWLVNEINTLPGFTSISMYPKLWATSGLSYQALLQELISLAIQRKEKQKKLKRHY